MVSIPARSQQTLPLLLTSPCHPTSLTPPPENVSFQDTPGLFPNQWTCAIPICIPGLVHPHIWICLLGIFLLCCKDLLQMLMLSFRWRALRLICQNAFHTLLLKLCPLLFPAFKLKRSPACRRHGGEQLAGCVQLRGRQSEGLSTAQVSIVGWWLGRGGRAGKDLWGESKGLCWALWVPSVGEVGGSEHPLKQDRFQHLLFHGSYKPVFKVHHLLGMRTS